MVSALRYSRGGCMRDENLIWRKNLFITRGVHRAACSRKEVMNEEVLRRSGAHPKRAPISSSLRPPLAQRAGRLRMRAASRAIPQEEGARLWKGSLPALSLREDLRDCFLSGPAQAPAGEGLGGGLLRGVERTTRHLLRTALVASIEPAHWPQNSVRKLLPECE